MTYEEYFKDWTKVINKDEFYKIINWLVNVDKSNLCPTFNNIFNCFHYCDLNNLKVIILGSSPYSQLNVATGIAFGNKSNKDVLSPALQVIKESVINYEIPKNNINFDPTFLLWEKQGVLMLNCALTCNVGLPNIHMNVWKPFISSLIYNMSRYMTACVYLLFGTKAHAFVPYIDKHNYIIKEKDISYYIETNQKLNYNIWNEINNHLNNKVIWKDIF